MPKIFTRVAPIKPITSLVYNRLDFDLAEVYPFSDELDITPAASIPVFGNLPLTSSITNIPLRMDYKISLYSHLPIPSPNIEQIPSFDFQVPLVTLYSLERISNITQVRISENLFKGMKGPELVSGMSYVDRYWRTERIDLSKENKKQSKKQEKRNIVNPKDLHELYGRKLRKPRSATFWDLIFVLLQPPLNFRITESLLLPADLRPYQIDGVKFLIQNQHALLADDMGTGKTVMTTVAFKLLLRANKITKGLILCPNSVLYEWKKHIRDWSPEIIACFVRGTKELRVLEWNTPAHVYVTTYDTLRSDVENRILPKEKLSSFDLIVVDEAHHIKNPGTNRARAIKSLQSTYRWALTGTPIQNKIEDLAAIFDFVYPKYLTPYDLYPEKIKKKVEPFFLRRRKIDVLKDLPEKIKQDIWLDMSSDQEAEYDRVERDIQIEIEKLGTAVTKQHIFAKMQKLKQICNFPTGTTTSPKLDALKEQIESIIAGENKAIIFSQYIEQGIEKLRNPLKNYGIAVIEGGQSDFVRTSEINKFKSDSKISLMLASLKSGGEGLNLTEASYVVHFDHWWNPAVMWQAEDRVHRHGQKKSVNIYSYWMSGTIDERIYRILKDKGLLIENVVDGLSEKDLDELITMDDLLEIIGAKKVEKKTDIFEASKWKNLNAEQIRAKLLSISPYEFEDLIGELMHYLGYENVKVTKRSGDGGIDVISTSLTINGVERVAAQCKRYKIPIGVEIARAFAGAISDDPTIKQGYLITTSDFSPECINFCIRHNIELISGLRVASYIMQFGLDA